jgi:hypothetical protein
VSDEPEFPFMDGQGLRDAGITRVMSHQEAWTTRCYRLAEQFIEKQTGTFTGEDVRYACMRNITRPHHPNAWGGLINMLVKRRVIRATGQYQQPKDRVSHARAIQVYERNV